ncbi:hypothetical protein HETIRDRAFT_422598 [Heterobasidion irregulare TC 32-1]|uniref:Uncharacterized protein n=1 Tax=Heterobasidion irregulare (strain TC 32-1) TaxID=747525 RepID=W4JR07_HETIT|nr:uncharacterized protein HETIRDRAFT_422598 [Heterobasidion irregulare TC 32-1]ETW75978.1 hypothetical protein HETIRDRAFT_422598 [Heterobasidion irregulare TC 32-1]
MDTTLELFSTAIIILSTTMSCLLSQKTKTSPKLFGSERVQKVFNLVTYKYHSLRDYIYMILCFKIMDLYSIQVLTRHDTCECLLCKVVKQSNKHYSHYHIAVSMRKHFSIWYWIHNYSKDPMLKDFLPCLQDHLLAYMLRLAYNNDEQDFTNKDHDNITIINN